MNNEIGINEEKLDKLILDLYDYCEKVNTTLDQVCEVVDNTKTFYTGDIADSYRKKFDMYRTNFPIIKNNLTSYADDLIKLKSKINLLDTNISYNTKKAATELSDKIQPITSIPIINVNGIPKNNIGASKNWR